MIANRQQSLWVTMVVVATACGGAGPPPTAGASSVAGANMASSPSSIGSLSESEFKRLHELRSDAPPRLNGTMVDLAGSRAYLSLPTHAAGPVPAIVVVHEWWGLNDHIKHWADRLAGLGWAALAVDLYGGHVAGTPDEAMQAMKSVDDATARKTIAAALRFLGDDARVQAKRRAVIGWCFGGGWALQTAIATADLDAAIMYYGHPDTDAVKLAQIRAEMLGIFGNRDKAIPPSVVDVLDIALSKAHVRHVFLRYDADHAFANPSNPKYDEKSAEDAWNHVKAFLARVAK